MPNNDDGNLAVAKREHIKHLLERYPNISGDEKTILLRWYRKEASSLDVAMMSQINAIKPGYQAFKSEMDRFTWREAIFMLIFIGGIAGALAAINFLAA